jgi:hypothetical protein
MKLTFVAVGVVIAAITPALADEPLACRPRFRATASAPAPAAIGRPRPSGGA